MHTFDRRHLLTTVVGAGAAVTAGRWLESAATESLYFPFTHVPQAMTVYFKFVQRAALGANGTIFHIGSATAANDPRLILTDNTTIWAVTHDDGATATSQDASGAPSSADLVEIAIQLQSDGEVVIIQSINSAAATSAGPTSTAVALGSAWADTRLYLNSAGTSTAGTNDHAVIKIAAGVQTMDKMRAL